MYLDLFVAMGPECHTHLAAAGDEHPTQPGAVAAPVHPAERVRDLPDSGGRLRGVDRGSVPINRN